MMWEYRWRHWGASRLAGVVVSTGLHGLVLVGLCLQAKPGPGQRGIVVPVELIGHSPIADIGSQQRHADIRRHVAETATAGGGAMRGSGAHRSQAPAVAEGSETGSMNGAKSADASALTGLQGQDELHYQDELLAYITRFRAYPDAARLSRLTGRVMIRFAMSREGKVIDVWVDQTSGQPILDAAAKDTVLRAQPLPAIPAGLPSILTVSLPVDFSPPAPA